MWGRGLSHTAQLHVLLFYCLGGVYAAAELSPEHVLLPAALSVVLDTDVAIGTVLFHISFVRRLRVGSDLQHCVGLLLGYPLHAVLAFFFFFPSVTLSLNTAVSCIILFYPLSTIVDARG